MEIVLGEGVVVGTSIVRFVAKLRLSIVARVEEAEETRGEDTIELDEVAGEMGLDQVVINAARTKIGERTVEGGTVGTEDHISTALRRRVAPFQPPACRSFSGRHGDGRGRGKALENAPRATAHALGRIEHADAATLSLVKAGQGPRRARHRENDCGRGK